MLRIFHIGFNKLSIVMQDNMINNVNKIMASINNTGLFM